MVITAAHLSPLLALLFGLLILVLPRILNYLVAIYLILSGLLGLGFLVVPARTRAAAEVPTNATAFAPNQQPIAFSLVHCHTHTSSDRQRTAKGWTMEPRARQAQAIKAMAMVESTRPDRELNDVSIAFQ